MTNYFFPGERRQVSQLAKVEDRLDNVPMRNACGNKANETGREKENDNEIKRRKRKTRKIIKKKQKRDIMDITYIYRYRYMR